jgi:hypothetical protein
MRMQSCSRIVRRSTGGRRPQGWNHLFAPLSVRDLLAKLALTAQPTFCSQTIRKLSG